MSQDGKIYQRANANFPFYHNEMSISALKFHPLYECQHVPQRTETDRKLLERVKKLKTEGAKIKKQEDTGKMKMKFQCAIFDLLTNT